MIRTLLIGLLLVSGSLQGASLSDIAVESLQKEITQVGGRNPFTPAQVEGEIDVTTLLLEGTLISRQVQLSLLSGRILRVGDKVGAYLVEAIDSGSLSLKKGASLQLIRMDGFILPLKKANGGEFQIEFRNADLKDALRMLAKAGGYNLITPEEMTGRVNLSFENTSLKTAIKAILKVNNFSYAIENNIMRVGKPDEFQGGTDLLAITIPLKFAKAKDLEDKVKLLLSEKGSVGAEERSNVLSVKDYDANIEIVRQFIVSVDQKDQQVSIEAHIVDATSDFSRSLGVQWGITATPQGNTIAGADSTGTFTVGGLAATKAHVNLGASSPTSGGAFRIGSLPGGTNIDFQVTAAEKRGDIQIISKPSVTTINNKPAKIRSGTTIYVKSTSNISIGTTGGTGAASQPSLQAIETGIQLDVTPQITPNRYVKLVIEATESEADFSKTVDGIPAILDNKATTTIVLKDGETAVIGGLIKRKESTSKRGVPGFSKIPVVGVFFKSKDRAKTHNELMVFITPRIIN